MAWTDVVVMALATFLANAGVAVTGFGMAIVFVLVWQIAAICGYDGDFKAAVFLQAIGLFVAQPQLIYNAKPWKHASLDLMKVFIPVTVISTPIGQLVGKFAPVKSLQAVAGVIVSVFAAFEVYRNRALIKQAFETLWKREGEQPVGDDLEAGETEEPKEKVFFMVGSQRSGSNWLRTFLDERNDLLSPHPPHIFDNFMPILSKFGNLHEDSKLEVFIEHVCTFVERNQVPWTDLHSRPIKFDRESVFEQMRALTKKLDPSKGAENSPDFVVAIFDIIMDTTTFQNAKRMWICKSMGMSKYHDILLRYYGPERLRYVYLVRDPRDVAMSFMNTPVGDCHYHAIVTKWCQQQKFSLKVLVEMPELVHRLHYEQMLHNKEETLEKLFDFIGEEKLPKNLSAASVMHMHDLEEMVEGAKSGREAAKAAHLSTQFMNLTKGEEFAKGQFQKWLNGPNPLSREDLILIESIAHATMKTLGYEPHLVTKSVEPTIWSESELAEFARLNKLGIQKMNADLAVENPGDAKRRIYQAAVLKWDATLEATKDTSVEVPDYSSFLPSCGLSGKAGSAKESGAAASSDLCQAGEAVDSVKLPKETQETGTLLDKRRTDEFKLDPGSVMDLPGGYKLRFSGATQAGYHPKITKANQDSFLLPTGSAGSGINLLAVYDGHGPAGDKCSQFALAQMPKLFTAAVQNGSIAGALKHANVTTNTMMEQASDVDDAKSGTTAIMLVLDGLRCHISNVGDSKCFLGSVGTNQELVVKPLSWDHTLYRKDEVARVKSSGARVLNMNQLDGSEPIHENWVEGQGSAPRVWAQNEMNPGTQFTRSIGDQIAKSLGVFAEPEIIEHTISASDRVFILTSDGITDVMSLEETCQMALSYSDACQACKAIVDEAYRRWSHHKDLVDDITCVLAFVEPPGFTDNNDIVFKSSPAPKAEDRIEPQAVKEEGLDLNMLAWAGSMGFASGFLGGLCGIRGPPIIIFFLHMTLTKTAQRGNGAAITLVNICMRIIFYLVEIVQGIEDHEFFSAEDWPVYLAVIVASPLGVVAGAEIFKRMKDSQAKIKTMLACLLVLCGISLLITGFM